MKVLFTLTMVRYTTFSFAQNVPKANLPHQINIPHPQNKTARKDTITLCLGGEYVYKAKQGLMTEVCNSINFNISEKEALAVVRGYYFFDSTNNSRSTQFMGFSFTYNFLRKHGVNIQRKKKTLVNDN